MKLAELIPAFHEPENARLDSEGLTRFRFMVPMHAEKNRKGALHELPRADKFHAVQFLTAERAQGEGGLLPGAEYPLWSPFEAHDAAARLTQYLLEQTETR